MSSDGYFVTDLRIGEASNPGPLPRNQRMYMASTRAGDKSHQTKGGDNLADTDGHLKYPHTMATVLTLPSNG